MTKYRSLRRLALFVLPAVMLVSATAAQASIVMYSLVPFSYADSINTSNVDTLTGTFTLSSAGNIFGTWSVANLPTTPITLTANLSVTSSGPVSVSPVSASASFDLATLITNNHAEWGGVGLIVNPTSVELQNIHGSYGVLDLEFPLIASQPWIDVRWIPTGEANNQVFINAGFNPGSQTIQAFDPNGDGVYGAPPTPWVLASVPEPVSLTVWAVLLGLGGVLFVRRRRVAIG